MSAMALGATLVFGHGMQPAELGLLVTTRTARRSCHSARAVGAMAATTSVVEVAVNGLALPSVTIAASCRGFDVPGMRLMAVGTALVTGGRGGVLAAMTCGARFGVLRGVGLVAVRTLLMARMGEFLFVQMAAVALLGSQLGVVRQT